MRLGILADIHGDPRALESALRQLDGLDVDRILCAGDLVGYGIEADAVVSILQDREIPCIRGNHDRWAVERRRVIGLRGWKLAHFQDQTWERLEALPPSHTYELEGRTLAIHHGSPASDTEFVMPFRPLPPSVEAFWNESGADVLILGHSHLPMIERCPQGLILNPGSVMGVSGHQTSYSFAVLELETLAVCIHDVRTGREIRRDPVFLGEP